MVLCGPFINPCRALREAAYGLLQDQRQTFYGEVANLPGKAQSLCFRFNIRPWQLVVKMDTNAVWKSLETGKHYRFLAKKEIEGRQAHTFNTCNLHSCKEIWLIR